MSLKEYKDKMRYHNRVATVWIVGLVLGAVVLLAALIAMVTSYRELRPLAIGVLVGYVMFTLFNLYRIDNYFRRVPGLVCPSCDSTLAKHKSIVLATGSCPSCENRVLEDHWVSIRKREHRAHGIASTIAKHEN
jgi:hypothetical protein